MTKEPIMIDDVDVSECEFFSSGLGYCTIGLLADDGTHICECEQNCYYKQLKRKEQECEELLTKIKIQKEENIKFTLATRKLVSQYSSKLEKLRQALKKNKAKLKEFKDMAKKGLDNYKDVGGCWGCGISLAFDELLKTCKALETKNAILISNRMNMFERLDIVQKNKKYEQALQEIKKIAEDDCKTCTVKLLGEDEINCKRCYKTKILQKCEVIDD